jgi:hypothetical protein
MIGIAALVAKIAERRARRAAQPAGNASRTITEQSGSFVFRAVSAAEDRAFRFNAVAHDAASAVFTRRCQALNCALEAVEGVRLAIHYDDERFIVFVSAGFTFGHNMSMAGAGRVTFTTPSRPCWPFRAFQ